jgi:hypothetical protein
MKGAPMNRTTQYALAALMLCALLAASCTRPQVEIEVNPKQLSSPGLVQVTWKTKDLETTTISSNPAVSGLPKTVTGNASRTDSFQVNATTTFQIRAQTGQQNPLIKIASATVTVGTVR